MSTATATKQGLALVVKDGVEIVESSCHDCGHLIQDLTLRVFCDPCLNLG